MNGFDFENFIIATAFLPVTKLILIATKTGYTYGWTKLKF